MEKKDRERARVEVKIIFSPIHTVSIHKNGKNYMHQYGWKRPLRYLVQSFTYHQYCPLNYDPKYCIYYFPINLQRQ